MCHLGLGIHLLKDINYRLARNIDDSLASRFHFRFSGRHNHFCLDLSRNTSRAA